MRSGDFDVQVRIEGLGLAEGYSEAGLMARDTLSTNSGFAAVLAPERVSALPKIPTSAEAGMPGLVVITWYGLFAPAGVKPDIVERVNGDVVRFMTSAETKAQLSKVELDAKTGTPAEFATFVREETARWGRVIREANIRTEQ